jgi:hypothetical protein
MRNHTSAWTTRYDPCVIRRCLRYMFLLPPLLALILWLWSYGDRVDFPSIIDTLHYPNEPKGGEIFIYLRIDRGTVQIRHGGVEPGAPCGQFVRINRWGFACEKLSDNRYQAGTFVDRHVYAPMWSIFLLTLLYPSAKLGWFVRGPLRRARRLRMRRCEACGYDLTGNVSGVCSECGMATVRRGPIEVAKG